MLYCYSTLKSEGFCNMDINSIEQLNAEIQSEQVRAMYGVKLAKMAQESEQVVGSVIQDTVEISQEAMNKFLAEVKH